MVLTIKAFKAWKNRTNTNGQNCKNLTKNAKTVDKTDKKSGKYRPILTGAFLAVYRSILIFLALKP